MRWGASHGGGFRSAQFHSQRGFQFGQSLRPALYFDRRHAGRPAGERQEVSAWSFLKLGTLVMPPAFAARDCGPADHRRPIASLLNCSDRSQNSEDSGSRLCVKRDGRELSAIGVWHDQTSHGRLRIGAGTLYSLGSPLARELRPNRLLELGDAHDELPSLTHHESLALELRQMFRHSRP